MAVRSFKTSTFGNRMPRGSNMGTSPILVDYLVVAGGGGGGGGCCGSAGGGGGAGGLLTSSITLPVANFYTVVVGAGGAGDTNGSNSIFNLVTALVMELERTVVLEEALLVQAEDLV